MKVYLASPWFTLREEVIYKLVIKKMRSEGIDVYVPMEHEIRDAWEKPNEVWAREVFSSDVEAIQSCDEVWVLNFGMYSDSGTAWECGFAYGIGKTVRMLLDTENENVFSLMMINGCEEYDSVKNYLKNLDLPIDKIEQK